MQSADFILSISLKIFSGLIYVILGMLIVLNGLNVIKFISTPPYKE